MKSADQPKVIPLWPDGAPGSEDWTQQEQETVLPPPESIKVVHNVTEPTLTAFLPNPSVASGTAIIVCPGGAFHMLAIEHDAQSRPHFAAAIYGALWEEIIVPADAPALFIALANDDEIAVEPSVALYRAWRAAGQPVELHIYAQGGHGFGMRKQGLPADHWIDRFGEWLQVQGFLQGTFPLHSG